MRLCLAMENFNYKMIRALWRLGALLPFKFLYLFSDIVYLIIYYVARYRRKIVRDNLVNSFPEKSLAEIIDIEKKFYSSFCDYMVETVKLMRMSPERIKKHMRFEGVDELEQMLSGEGKSSMVYIGHLFNWEFITSLPLHFKNPDVKFGQIYHPLASKAMDDLFLELRGQYGSESIAMKNTLRRILELSNQKKPFVIGAIADQVPTWESIKHWLTFFHRDTPVFTGSEKIARLPCHFHDETNFQTSTFVCTTESIHHEQTLTAQLLHSLSLQVSPSFFRARLVVVLIFI